ncbi:hypothetical protein DB346_25180 [Verrucomicrobia bacterium LW23]|nr:hypothetical protein DB346_25180 [Verrucomicrobia bacterium LW23]
MRWSFSATPEMWVAAVAILALCGWLSWMQWVRRGRTKRIAVLEAIRLLAVALLCIALLKPELVEELKFTQQPEVLVLWDASGSMASRDIETATNVVTRADWLEIKRNAQFWKPLEEKASVVVENFSPPPADSPSPAAPGAPNSAPAPDATPTPATSSTNSPPAVPGVTPPRAPGAPLAPTGTDLATALEKAVQRKGNLKAVLVLTDGDWNLGGSPVSPAGRLRARNVPVYTVGVGSEVRLPDLALLPSQVPSYGLSGEQISVPFRIQSFLPRDIETEVSLATSAGKVATKRVRIPAYGQVQDAILWAAGEPGEFPMRLSVPVEPEEILKDNNDQQFRIAVRRETLRVLVVDSLPRWEYRYLRNALMRDPGVDVDCYLKFPQGLGVGEGAHYIRTFPSSKELISKYDVIFLGDVGPNEISARDCELIRGLVEQQGSGLVLLPGSRGSLPALANTVLADMIPVEFETEKNKGMKSGTEWNLHLTSEGRGHLLTMLANSESANVAVWKSLPGFYWNAGVKKAKTGTEVLAVHSALRNEWGRLPLLVTKTFGNGKVLFMGTDAAWRWRKGVEDTYHYRFWGQVVRWMSHQRHLAGGKQVRLSFTPEDPHVGDAVLLLATVFEVTGFPVETGRVVARVTAPSGATERIELQAQAGGWGVFRGQFIPREGGAYSIRLVNELGPQSLDTEILVTRPTLERTGQPANLGVLREISALTGGAYAAPSDLERLIQQIALLPDPVPLQQRISLWSQWWFGLAILLLLTIYWAGRKLSGMI